MGIPVPPVGIKIPEILDGQGVENSPYLISDNIRSTTNNNIAAESKKFVSEEDPEGSYLGTEEVFKQLRSLGIDLNPTVRKVVIQQFEIKLATKIVTFKDVKKKIIKKWQPIQSTYERRY